MKRGTLPFQKTHTCAPHGVWRWEDMPQKSGSWPPVRSLLHNSALDFLAHPCAMRLTCVILNETAGATQGNFSRVLPICMCGAPQCLKHRGRAHDGTPGDISSPTVSPQEKPRNHSRYSYSRPKLGFPRVPRTPAQ